MNPLSGPSGGGKAKPTDQSGINLWTRYQHNLTDAFQRSVDRNVNTLPTLRIFYSISLEYRLGSIYFMWETKFRMFVNGLSYQAIGSYDQDKNLSSLFFQVFLANGLLI